MALWLFRFDHPCSQGDFGQFQIPGIHSICLTPIPGDMHSAQNRMRIDPHSRDFGFGPSRHCATGPYFKVIVISGSALVNIAHVSVASQILNSLFVAWKTPIVDCFALAEGKVPPSVCATGQVAGQRYQQIMTSCLFLRGGLTSFPMDVGMSQS